jgi:hypothetical protein
MLKKRLAIATIKMKMKIPAPMIVRRRRGTSSEE